ncbi:alpha/beta hydrolase [Nitratireductor sp. GISD-1A_MAKvit]|uniref:alpha/beta fold hydrolase n=1 Tax=Nitratireductor sp. GISD-1A_MAKvit TaxID=3234198 RepID=UPI003465ED64
MLNYFCSCLNIIWIPIMNRFVLRSVKILFGILQHVAPSLAGRIAFDLFRRTPHPGRMTDGEKRAVAFAQDFMQEARIHRLASSRGRFVAYEFCKWGARRDGPTVLLIHGWGSRTEHMRGLAGALLQRGFRVVSLDLPGHGASEGRVLDIASAVAAVHATAQWLGPFDAMVGHSFGGAVALNAVSGAISGIPPVPVRRMVMIASPNALPELFSRFGRFIGLLEKTQGLLERHAEEIAGQPLTRFVGANQLRELDIPTLVVHAPDDREVSPQDARALGRAGGHVSLVWARGLGHRRILAAPQVAECVAAFIESRRERKIPERTGGRAEERLPMAN